MHTCTQMYTRTRTRTRTYANTKTNVHWPQPVIRYRMQRASSDSMLTCAFLVDMCMLTCASLSHQHQGVMEQAFHSSHSNPPHRTLHLLFLRFLHSHPHLPTAAAQWHLQVIAPSQCTQRQRHKHKQRQTKRKRQRTGGGRREAEATLQAVPATAIGDGDKGHRKTCTHTHTHTHTRICT